MNRWQRDVAKFCAQLELECRPAERVLDVVSEVGEVAKEVLLATDYGKADFVTSKNLSGEIGDALFSLLALANSAEVDVEAALRQAMRKYERRERRWGGVGSGPP